MSILLGACIFYIVQGNVSAKTRYSVKTFTPQGEVPQWTDFSITFSESIIDKSRVGTEVPAEALRFTPAVQGTARWVAFDRIGFFLDAPLAPSAEYTVELTSEINPSEAFQLTGQKEFKFATEPFTVQQTRMEFSTDETREYATGLGTIAFNYLVTTADLKAHLSIALDDGTEIPYQIQTNTATARTVKFETTRIKRGNADREIKVKIEKGFKCIGGQIGLEKAHVTPVILRVRGTLGVTYSDVRESNGKPYISVNFSAPILSDTVEPYIELTPAVDYQMTSGNRNIKIYGNFKRRTTYTLKIRRGLTARNDAILKQDYVTRLRIPDLQPQLRFLGNGFFLARKGHLNLGLATINVKRVELDIEKVFANNLIYVSRLDRWRRWSRNLGKPIHSEKLDIPPQLNKEVTTPISLEEYLSDERVGIFKVVARNADRQWDGAHRWVLITDLGISAKRTGDHLYVWVKSLATGAPVPTARVQVISDNNQTLLSGTTNWAGFVEFTEVAGKTEDFIPFMITVAKRDDLAFIQLDRHEIATVDFDIAGPAYLQKGYEAFLYTSRGVYRPGETVQLAGIVRGPKQATPEPLPTRIEVISPDGRIMRELRQQTNKSGACDVKIPIPDYALTGNYIAKMKIADQVIGRVQFQVEEFMPDRMKVDITTDKSTYKLGEELDIEVNAINLFGPPAVGRKVQASCQLKAVPFVVSDDTLPPGTDATKWRSFVFGNTKKFDSQRIELGEAKTDAEGKARYQFTVPATLKSPSLLNGILTATVSEVGGRAVTASQRVVIHPYAHYAGIRRTTTGEVKINKPLRFDYVAVDDTMAVVPGRALKLSLHKVHWNTILRQNAAGRYEYVSEPQMIEVKTQALTSAEAVQTIEVTPLDYGEYRVRLEDIESTATAETRFYVSGWRNTPVSMEHPTQLDLTLDKPVYRPGQTAKLNIKAPFPGTLLLTVERDRVLSHRTIVMKENTATLSIPVRDAYKPNVYLSATLTRTIPMDTVSQVDKKSLLPARAFGVIPLKIDATRRQLSIEMSLKPDSDQQERLIKRTPLTDRRGLMVSDSQFEAVVHPNSEIDIAFQVHGRRSWQKYDVCIAAIDEGILTLTDFQTPNPHAYFYQQRGLKTRSFDLYSGILPEIADVTDNSSTGGDAASGRFGRKRLNTSSIRRVKPVSLWSGFVKTDGNGRGTVQFKIPQFNGKLRLMVVAFAGADYGATEAYLTVREPIVLTPTFPRFLAGGDKVRVPVTLFNGTGEDGEFTVKLQASGDVQLLSAGIAISHQPSAISKDTVDDVSSLAESRKPKAESLFIEKKVEADTEAQVFFDIRVHDAIGVVNFNLSAQGNTETTEIDVKLPLRSVAPPITKTGHGVVSAGKPVDFILPANLIADSSEFSLTLSPFPNIAFAGSLRYLVRYPHGCLEQTTSKVFPLLYFSDLARSVEPMLAAEDSVDYYITSGITKLESMLMTNNQFSYWPGGTYVNPWSSIYASHFLVEARKAGYEVADRVYDAILEGLRAQAKFSPDTEDKDDAKKVRANIAVATYASYVLAAAGQPDRGTMHYLKNRGASGLSDYSHFQLAGAFALSGELETALSMLPVSVSPSLNGKGNPERETGGTFNSSVRAQAIMLDVLAEVNENHPSIPMLVKNLSEAASDGNRWGTTQDNAFAFLALGKIMKKQIDRNYTGTFKLNGEHFADFDATEMRYTDEAWDGARVQLTVKGKGSCYYYWSAFGIQRDSFIEEYEHELQVRRRYFNKDGEGLTSTFVHGDLIIAEITVKALTANLENVVVVDMLPTGFEIENPRLESRAGIPWLKAQEFKPDYLDIRDDRLIFFGTFPHQRERKFYYALRAVTQGEFTLPPISAEAMYDPTKSAVVGSMGIKIVAE